MEWAVFFLIYGGKSLYITNLCSSWTHAALLITLVYCPFVPAIESWGAANFSKLQGKILIDCTFVHVMNSCGAADYSKLWRPYMLPICLRYELMRRCWFFSELWRKNLIYCHLCPLWTHAVLLTFLNYGALICWPFVSAIDSCGATGFSELLGEIEKILSPL